MLGVGVGVLPAALQRLGHGAVVAPGGQASIVLLGQSELHRLFLSSHADLGTSGTVVDESALELWWYDLDTNSPNNATGVQRDAITNANKVSRWAVEMSNALAALAPGTQFKVCCLLFSGTGLDDLLDDAMTAGGRYWTRPDPYNGDADVYAQFVADLGIAQPDAAMMSWQNTDSTQIQFQIGDAWWVALTGTRLDDGSAVARGSQIHNVDYDHFLSDLWDTTAVPFTMLMHRYDVFSGAAVDWGRFRDVRVSFDRMVGSAHNQARGLPFLRGVDPMAYENGYDVADDSHPAKNDDGATKYAQQIAYNMARATGTNLAAPQIDTVTWATGSVTLSSNAGPMTTTRILRSGALPAGQPKVAQLYFRSADDPETLHEVGDAAISLTGGDIVIDASTLLTAISAGRTTFQRGDALEFASGPGGANDAQDKTDDTWLDYPGIAHATLELVPLQPENGVLRCDLAGGAAPTNLLVDFATWAASKGLIDQGDGWYIAPTNVSFDSNVSGELDNTSLAGGVASATIVVDLDREIGVNNQNSTQVNLRDISGAGHQRIQVQNLWSDPTMANPTANVATYGYCPLPEGRTRIWAHVSATASSRHILYLNSGANGGAFGFAGLYDGALTVEQIAALG